ncbi:MAG: hypothetical protein VYC24_00050 [Acidobacteriota bacterium]|nr:hypothetical protein [Acidobacteriota bacterium]
MSIERDDPPPPKPEEFDPEGEYPEHEEITGREGVAAQALKK